MDHGITESSGEDGQMLENASAYIMEIFDEFGIGIGQFLIFNSLYPATDKMPLRLYPLRHAAMAKLVEQGKIKPVDNGYIRLSW